MIADTGAGHRSAANAISNAIKIISQEEHERWLVRQRSSTAANDIRDEVAQQQQGSADSSSAPPATYRIEIVDVFEEYSRFPLREAVKLYGPTIRYNPKLYGEVFRRTNREQTIRVANTLSNPLIMNGLLRLITTVQPDVIVSIHPLLNHITLRALRELGLSIPFLTVVTDLISAHNSWFAPGADGYVVPTEQVKQLYLKKRLDPKRVHVLGMPIDPKFTRAVDSKKVLRERFDLRQDLPVILLVGGGDGAGGLHLAVRAISQARLQVQLLVVTGRNRALYARLQRTRSSLHVPAKILGFVNNMPELMHASDVIVTKAGPGTICEALTCGLPIVLSGYVPGQEEGNVEFVERNNVGVLAHDTIELVDELRHLIKPGSPELRERRANAQRLSRPRASFEIAQFILGYVPVLGEESVWQSARWRSRQQKLSNRLRSAIRLRRRGGRLSRPLLNSTFMRRLTRLRIRDLTARGPTREQRR